MSSTENEAQKLLLVQRLPNHDIRHAPLDTQDRIAATAGAEFAVVQETDGRAPQELVARRQDDDLVVEVADEPVLTIEGFFATEDVVFLPDAELTGDQLAGTTLTPQSSAVAASSDGDGVVWSADAGDHNDGGFQSSHLWWGAAGVGGMALAASVAHDGGSDASGQVAGTIVGGPVIDGNGLTVQVFAADGVTKLGQAKVGADGSFLVDVGDYSGVVIARVFDADAGPDYLDEALGEGKDLNGALSGIEVVAEPNTTAQMNLNVVTTLAAELAARNAAGSAPTAEQVAAANEAIANVFGLGDLHDTAVAPVNGGNYDAADGLSAGEVYGAILAAFSGADAANSGDSQATIDAILAGLTAGDEGAVLSESAQEILVKGANDVESRTGQVLTDDVAGVVDTHAPKVTSGSVATGISENSGEAQVVYVAAATDAGDVIYSLKAADDHAAFSIDADTGAVTLVADPDHESKSSYSFTVVATDTAGNSSEQAVTLAVTDLDDIAPSITSGATAAAMDENAGADRLAYTATADDSADVSGGVTFSVKPVGDHAAFAIDADTGAVTLSGDPDHEAKSSYSFTVVATDTAGNSSEQAVTLAVNDLDEAAPSITSGAAAPAIDENSGAGRAVYTATAIDGADVSDGVTFSLKGGNGDDAAAFSIDASTGEVALTGDQDHETQSSYSFTVVATDAAGNSSEQTVTLAVTDLDEAAPSITSVSSAPAIDENSGAGQVIYTATADDSADVSGGVTFSLKAGNGDDAGAFSIDAGTGEVILTGDPDHETKSSYSFAVVATDAAGNSSEQTVTLNVTDLDEAAPSITSGATATAIDENSGASQVVYTAAADDSADVSGGVTFSLKAVDDHGAFTIDANTGAVTLTGAPDHEAQGSYSFTVVATDAAGNRSEQSVTLPVTDLDEVDPVITSSATATAIDENTGAGNVVYTATADDSADVSGGVTFSLKAVDDHAAFSIDPTTGAVTLTGDPDHEAKSGYSFTVVATDAAGNSSEQALTLAVTDLDEVAPSITSGATATTLDENSGSGQVVYTATADDSADVSDGVTFSLKAVDDHAAFSIDASTGAVSLTGDPDHETQSGYAFTVVATDAAGNSSEQAINLAVTDLDEAAPGITSGTTATAIDENSGASQVVYTATADDSADVSAGVTFSLKAVDDHAAFSIDAATGAVTLAADPNHEIKPSYSFTVVATDAAGNSNEQAVTLAVTDLDETAPSITSGAMATAIDENAGPGNAVYTATADDSADVSGGVAFSLKAVADHSAFTIDAATGEVTLTGDPDHETKSSYSFTVVATDAAGNSSEQAVALNVTDLDEVAPSITSGATAAAIDENSGASQVVYTAAADDSADVSGGVTFSLKAVGDHAAFTIDAATGAVTLTGDPDHEAKSSYSFTVVATDAADNSSEQVVALNVTDLDEVAPTITSGAVAPAVDENGGAGQVVYTAVADDSADVSAGVTFSLKSANGDDAAAFSIDAGTGAVTLTGDPDHEAKSSYSFTVVVTDAAGNSTEQAVTLGISDLDEVAPTVTSGALAAAIDENSGAGQLVYTATADDSADVSDGVTFSLKAADDHAAFSIDASTGTVTLTADPDHEAKSSYSFTVVATDAAGNSSEQAVALAVTDLDDTAPGFTSGATATALDENSGAGQVVYTATADDSADVSGGVTFSLSAVNDHTALSIDASTGAVTLSGDPDHEAKSSYSFTVVATDAAGNSSEQAVTLAVTDLDEVAPTITSGATATAIDENSGAGRVVYDAAADDSADVSGGVTFSLKAVDDHGAFTIDAGTGAVTLTGDPDFETKPSYSFTVVATDAAGNSSERAVTLAINDFADETAPTVGSVALSSATGRQNNTLNAGDTVSVTVAMSENTVVDTTHGTPRVALDIGGSTVYAGYVSGSGTSSLVFQYTVQAAQTDANGISIPASALELNNGSLADAAGNAAVLTHAFVADNASYAVDTTAPTLSSSSPADGASTVAVGANIVLTFDENVYAGTGNITISDGAGDTRTISVTDGSQVSISGNQVTIDPTANLNAARGYHVQIDNGALTDAAGNAYTGISDSTTLNLTTENPADTSIVVFDLIGGVTSDHSGRNFDAGTSYTIYVRVDSDSHVMKTDANSGNGTWGVWSGAKNLGADDKLILVGDGSPILGNGGGPITHYSPPSGMRLMTWRSSASFAAVIQYSRIYRLNDGVGSTGSLAVPLFATNNPVASGASLNGTLPLSQAVLNTMPFGILTSQGLV